MIAESYRWVCNIIISIVLKKGCFPYVRLYFKQGEYQIYLAQLSLQSLWFLLPFLSKWVTSAIFKEEENEDDLKDLQMFVHKK